MNLANSPLGNAEIIYLQAADVGGRTFDEALGLLEDPKLNDPLYRWTLETLGVGVTTRSVAAAGVITAAVILLPRFLR